MIGHPPVPLPGPPRSFVLARGALLVRFYNPTHTAGAVDRRFFGPVPTARFDHHPPPLREHESESVWYAASNLRCAVAEAFGKGVIDRQSNRRVALVEARRDLSLLDLMSVGMRRVGATQELARTTDYELTQEWARAFYGDRAYRGLRGLRWRGRQIAAPCIVLTDRAARSVLRMRDDRPIADPAVWPRIAAAARACRVPVV